MKFCEKCGKEILDETIGCNCSAETNADKMEPSQPNIEFLELIKNSKKTNIIAVAILVLGILSFLFVNGWLGAVLCFIAEMVALVPNSKVQKLFKTKHPELDKKMLKKEQKVIQNELKSKNKDFKFSIVLGSIALVLLVLSLILPSPLLGGNDSNYKDYSSTSTTTNATQSNVESTTDKSESNSSNKYAKEPVVGSYDYSESRDADTMTSVTISKPYISHMNFEADGTGNLTLKTADTSTGFSLYTTTWELVESADGVKKYAVYTNTNETISVFYYEDLDTCSTMVTLNGRTVMNVFKRYSGNAKDNVSGATTSAAYDVIGSYRFTHAYNPNTGYKTSSPAAPYTYYLSFYEGNSCLVQAQTNTSSNAYGLEFYNGSWTYDKQESGFYHYTLTIKKDSASAKMAVIYMPEDDVCVVSDTSGNYYYLERVVD